MTLHSKTCIPYQVDRAQAYHSLREHLSVSLSCRKCPKEQGDQVRNRPGCLGEHRNVEAQIIFFVR